ncbi:MAG: putative Ig domain-containing protein [Gammaproteobacteria bacterium]|nr:putative Ig domain-containing protein [Gammaproteobacteria bacterium]
MIRHRALLRLSAVLAAAAAGCGDGPTDPPSPARLAVSPGTAELHALGSTVQLTAEVRDDMGNLMAGANVGWTSSDNSVATVDTTGLVTATGGGLTVIEAEAGVARGHAQVLVEQVLASLEKTEGDGQRALEWSALPIRPTVRPLDANGHPINGTSVAFRVTEGGGGAAPDIVTAEEGRAGTVWTLGAAGPQVLVAEAGNASVEFTASAFAVGDPDFLAITTAHLSPAYASFTQADTIEAVGGRPPYTWKLTAGAVPPGLALTTDGVIRGMPQSREGSRFSVRVTDTAGNDATAAFELMVCAPPLLLEVGEVHIANPAPPGGCGFSVRAESAGSYYRVTLVGTTAGFESVEPVHFRVRGEVPEGAVASRSPAPGPVVGPDIRLRPSSSAPGARVDGHLRVRRDEARLLASLALEGRLRPLPDLGAATASTPAGPPPETWEFRLGSPGTVTDNCTVATRTTTVLQGYNDHLAIYAEPIPDSPLKATNIDILLRHYELYGAEVIESWGGVADVDGNGRIIVYLDATLPESITGLVWVGDMLPNSVCAASNEAELMRLERSWVEDFARIAASTVVHEAQHVNSVYKRLLNTLEDPFSYTAHHPVWVEEGRAVMAAEAASRLAWADLGGPASDEQVTAAHLVGLSDGEVGVSGILEALSRVKYVLREDANSLTHFPDPYGSGWHLHRFLADWYGGAGRGRLADAAFIRRLTATETPPGAAGIEKVTGRPFAELML